MDNTNLTYFFQVPQATDPINHIRKFIREKEINLKNPPNSEIVNRWTRMIKNMSEFLSFVETTQDKLSVLKKSNKGEEDAGIGQIVFFISLYKNPVRFTIEDKYGKEVTDFLYSDQNITRKDAYFLETRIKKLYLWYEKRPTTEESIGTVNNDEFKGFVKFSP